jgi:NitT/TauT family transport system ATP-binding protein
MEAGGHTATTSEDAMLSYRGASLTYPGTAGPVTALAGYSLDVRRGESIALIGPSGCGKSTSLLLAAGLLQPTEGCVRVAGESVARPRLTTALILQGFGLLAWKTVRENAALGLRIRRFPREERRRRTDAALERVGLSEFARMYPGELSGGMRQRLALARALALDVDLMLMDEPLSALDALLREDLQDMLLGLWQTQGYAQVLVTHSIEEAVFLGQRVVVLCPRPGRVAAIVDNPAMGAPDYRGTEAFHLVCKQVRSALQSLQREGRLDGCLDGASHRDTHQGEIPQRGVSGRA